jgi:Na+-transporting NADH:ubiquinone oxidoreductase subunit NqrF
MNPVTYVAMSFAVFTAVILGLTVALLVSRRYLVTQGDVTITVNGDPSKAFKVAPGQTLLSALSGQKVFLPSACGGGGTCAMCKCQVFDGAPAGLAAGLPGQGQAEHEHRAAGGDLRHPEVLLHGRQQRQRRHLHQGARAQHR